MYSENNTMGELLKLPAVRSFLEKVSPEMFSGPAVSYITPLTLGQLSGMQPGLEELARAIIALANGEEIDMDAFDPAKKKPVLQSGMGSGYTIDDVDGKLYMLDHRFSGCVVLRFSKKMDEGIRGRISYLGREIPWTLASVAVAGNLQMLAVFVRDFAADYGTEYTIRIEGFTDLDGNVMDPADYTFRTDEAGIYDAAYAEHDRIALRAAEEGIVLLKNEGNLLPLPKDASFALFGAEDFRAGAVGAGKINPRYTVRLGRAVSGSSFMVDPSAETGIIVISRASGENYDSGPFPGQYYLTEEEEKAISAFSEKYRKTIAIVNSGYPMDVRFIDQYGIDAALWCGYPGMLGGTALVNILNGSVNPSGRLPDTWSLDYDDIPASVNFFRPESPEGALDADHDVWVDTVYEEDIYVGYRYFETFEKPVAYPFGWGLSYTEFAVSGSMAGPVEAGDPKSPDCFAAFDISVKNTGKCAGREVVQLYARIPDGKLEQPAQRLAAFRKTALLQPGESECFTLSVPKNRLSSYDEDTAAYILEAGEYGFFLGNSVKNLTEIGKVIFTESETVRKTGDYMTPPVSFTRLSKNDPESFPKGTLSGIREGAHELSYRTKRKSFPVQEDRILPEVRDWTAEECARFLVCASSGWGMQDVGVAGRISQLPGREIPYFACADGNNGVNINKPNIGMPTSNLVCATWDEELAYEIGRVIAEEARENNVQMILAPAMNLHRNPLCGRHSEYYSEDPLLAGRMAGQQCRGLEENGVASSVKHVCCNNSEATRKRNHSIVSKRALRELYLRAFEYALEIQLPDSIMTAYNACNGVFTAEDEEMLQGIFREEYGFEGYIMTDWNSYDTADVALAVQAGNCWMTPGSADDRYVQPILAGLENGTVSEARLREDASYLLKIVKKRALNL